MSHSSIESEKMNNRRIAIRKKIDEIKHSDFMTFLYGGINVAKRFFLNNENIIFNCFVCLIFFVLFFIAGNANNPMVMHDEYTHKMNSIFLNEKEMNIPSYLFYGIYSIVALFGNNLFTARILNVLFLFFSAIVFYLILSRLNIEKREKRILFLLFLTIPSNVSYSQMFIQEIFYSFCFSLFAYVVLRFYLSGDRETEQKDGKALFLCGFSVALLSMVKPHGLFVICGFILFLLVETVIKHKNKKNSKNKSSDGIKSSFETFIRRFSIFIFFYFVVKISGDILFLGKIDFFGSKYSAANALAAENLEVFSLSVLIKDFIFNLIGHLSLISSLFGICAAFLTFFYFKTLFGNNKREEIETDISESSNKETLNLKTLNLNSKNIELELYSINDYFAIFSISIFICLIGATVFYTVYTHRVIDGDSVSRLHSRYYIFILPYLIASFVALQKRYSEFDSSKWKYFLLGIALVFSSWRLNSFIPSGLDCSELMHMNSFFVIATGIKEMFILGIFAASVRLKIAKNLYIFTFFVFCLISLFSSLFSYTNIDVQKGDSIGRAIAPIISSNVSDSVVVVGENYSTALRVLFHLENRNAGFSTPENLIEQIKKTETENNKENWFLNNWYVFIEPANKKTLETMKFLQEKSDKWKKYDMNYFTIYGIQSPGAEIVSKNNILYKDVLLDKKNYDFKKKEDLKLFMKHFSSEHWFKGYGCVSSVNDSVWFVFDSENSVVDNEKYEYESILIFDPESFYSDTEVVFDMEPITDNFGKFKTIDIDFYVGDVLLKEIKLKKRENASLNIPYNLFLSASKKGYVDLKFAVKKNDETDGKIDKKRDNNQLSVYFHLIQVEFIFKNK